ncbi:MAG: hypothetical protein IJ169_03735 [Paludibacteraceae bacterium]|nr:hypothetical protein [Paludibacteraceae bacterium]
MKRCLVAVLAILLSLTASADVLLTLHSGRTVRGRVVFRNDEVVVVRNAEGERFQYPVTEVESLVEVPDEELQPEVTAPRDEGKGKKVGVMLQLTGGAGFMPGYSGGGSMEARIAVGACNVLHRRIFIGLSTGWRGMWTADDRHFVPLQLYFAAPLAMRRHAPALGAAIGYGFAAAKGVQGGVAADVEAGWRCQITDRVACFVGLAAGLQQGSVPVTENIEGKTYTEVLYRTFCSVGLKAAIQF